MQVARVIATAISANLTPHYVGDALQSESLSELACPAASGEPFDAELTGTSWQQTVEGTAFGAPLTGWSVTHRVDCSDFDCRLEFKREDGSLVALILQVHSQPVDNAGFPKFYVYYTTAKEYERTELPFTDAALLTQDGRGTVACGSAGMLVQEVFGEPYVHESLLGGTEVRWNYTFKFTLHMDHLTEFVACPGTPSDGTIACTKP